MTRRLTPELCALIARHVPDPGPPPGVVVHTEDDYDEYVQALLDEGGLVGKDLWVFAYGSLLWKPACEVAEVVPAVLHGWRRSFCIRLQRFRGSPEEPGLMMSIVPGGRCRGALLRLPGAGVVEGLGRLLRREMTVKPANGPPRWVTVKARERRERAIVFAADPQGPNFAPRLGNDEVADILCRAAGHWGTGAEYLMHTVDELERRGIRDGNLWRLQAAVAERLEAMRAAAAAP